MSVATRRFVGLLTASSVAAIGLLGAATAPAPAVFQDRCNSKQHSMDNWRRKDAVAYAVVGRDEGYQWGGGCWNDNDKDDAPNDPKQNASTGGEGGDCSGFVFKVWALRNDANTSTFMYHDKMQNTRGQASGAWTGNTNWNRVMPRSEYLAPMDSLANSNHIAMIYTGQKTKEGLYRYIEAKGEDDGTGVWLRDYHNESYTRSSRRNWTADCHPQAC